MKIKLIGLIRMAKTMEMNPMTFTQMSYNDKEMLSLLASECGFPLSKDLFKKYADHVTSMVRIDSYSFITQDYEDFYHALLFYEKETLDFSLKNLAGGGVFVDVGANLGGFAVRCGKKARLYAFEPDPRNYELLTRNIKLNNLTNYKIFNKVVSNKKGKVNFYKSAFHGRNSVMKINEDVISAESITLDSILEAERTIDIIKIDVEGAELSVLEGSQQSLRKTRFVIVETSDPIVEKLLSPFMYKSGFEFLKKSNNNTIFLRK